LTKPLTIIGRSHSEFNKVSKLDDVTIGTSDVVLKGLEIDRILTTSSGPNPIPHVGLVVAECKVNSSLQLGNNAGATEIQEVLLRGNVLVRAYIYFDASDVLITNNIISVGSSHLDVRASNVIVANNVFRSTGSQIDISNNTSNGSLFMSNNMFLFNSTSTSSSAMRINLIGNAFNLSHNLTYNYGTGNDPVFFANSSTLIENNTLANTDPLFTDVDPSVGNSFAGVSNYNPTVREDVLTLQATSPALTGGTGGSEIGLYNNGFLYEVLGNPKGIPVLDIIDYESSVPKNTDINVTVKAVAK
jgi:hypothetical protein